MTREPLVIRNLGNRWHGGNRKQWTLVLSPSRSDLVVQSSFVFFQNPHREIYNLSMVSGPVLLKIKGTVGFCTPSGVNTTKKKQKQWNEFGQMLVPRALNDTKTIRKTGADIFPNFRLEKPWQSLYKSIILWIFPNCPVDFAKKLDESTYKRLDPKSVILSC